jgi:hypothetical protein
LAGEENISEVRLLNNQRQVPVYQVTVQQKYGNAIGVLSHRSNCLYKDMIMKPLACGYGAERYPSIWCPVFEKEAEQRSYSTLFSQVDNCEAMKNDEDNEMDSMSSLDNVDKVFPHFQTQDE